MNTLDRNMLDSIIYTRREHRRFTTTLTRDVVIDMAATLTEIPCVLVARSGRWGQDVFYRPMQRHDRVENHERR